MTTTAPPAARLSPLLLPLLAFGQFVAAIDYNIVYVALPGIGADLGFTRATLQWVISAYALAFGGLLLLGGRAADVLGSTTTYRAALWLFGAGSLLGALAPTSGVLIAGRALQGVGGALLIPATLALINGEFAEGPARNRALALWGGAGAIGLAAGSLLGGVLTEAFGWPSVFLVNVPLVAIALVVAGVALPARQRRGGFRDLDLPGALSITGAVTAFVFMLVQGPELGWTSSPVLAALPATVVLAGLFVAVERGAAAPILPVALLRHRPLATAMGITFLFMASFGTEYYLFTVYFQAVLGFSVLQAGLAFMPAAVVAAGVIAFTGRLLGRLGIARTLTIGLLLGVVGMLAIAFAMGTLSPYAALLPGIVALSLGQGIGWTAMFAAAGSGVEPGRQGIASALASTTQQIGAAVGLAVLVAIANAPVTDSPADVDQVVTGLAWAGVGAAALALLGVGLAVSFARTERRQAVDLADAD